MCTRGRVHPGHPARFALVRIPTWFHWQRIQTPDQSLIFQIPATVGFGARSPFGWLVQRSRDALAVVARRWWLHLLLGIAATAWLLHIVHTEPMAAPGITKNVFADVLDVAAWGWVLGVTGTAPRSSRIWYVPESGRLPYTCPCPKSAPELFHAGRDLVHGAAE